MTKHDIDRLRGYKEESVEPALITLFCIAAGICIVVGVIAGYCLKGAL